MKHKSGISETKYGKNENLFLEGLSKFTAPIIMTTSMILSGCNPPSSSATVLEEQGVSSSDDSMHEFSKIASLRRHFELGCKSIEEQYGIRVKIADANDTLYAIQNSRRNSKVDPQDQAFMNLLNSFSIEDWKRLNSVLAVLPGVFNFYHKSFISVVKTIYIADTIDNAGGFAYSNSHESHISSGNRSITIPSSSSYSKESIRTIMHHEITHVLHQARSELWPFVNPELGKNYSHQEKKPRGFARNYGTKNLFEDVATMGEVLTKSGEDSYNDLSHRMLSDSLLADKVMFMTGSFFDVRQARFTRDFSLEEFRSYFKLPDIQELPFYSRMRLNGSFDYRFWNKQLGVTSDKNDR